MIVIISDLHWGLGRESSGSWDPREDFRWSGALEAFLDQASRRGGDAVDLVILGDLLELWQPPDTVTCPGTGADLGCTPAEAQAVAEAVGAAHRADFDILRRFAQRGDNRLHLVPGNHDAALLLPEVWALVFHLLGGDQDRVAFAATGIWCSADGLVVAEHGHQIGRDVNRYANWPQITGESESRRYLVRPWGEYFVQTIFNEEERAYPIIDNLSPESAGVRYRMAERGPVGSATDMARFVAFNVFQTSLAQKAGFLGRSDDEEQGATDAADRARRRRERAQALGHKLFLQILAPADPLHPLIQEDSPAGRALRQELDGLLSSMDDPEVEALCLQAAQDDGYDPCADPASLGMLGQRLLFSKAQVMRPHLEGIRARHPAMTVFVYGHTHAAEAAWEVKLEDGRTVTVLNSGAFQRLVDDEGFRKRSAAWEHPSRGLVELGIEDLAPCYTSVVIEQREGRPDPRLEAWHCPETGAGSRVAPEDAACR